jgi:Rps23 Pro-64 3,4-dihydroxylase Tpa1-like proline 4-hydroxylase
MDAPRNSPRVNRVINFVYYFHRVPRPYTGGELLLFDSDVEADTYTRARFTRVVTEDNTIIFFPSPYYHSVLPVECPSKDFSDSRFAINGHVFRRLDVKPEHRDRAEPARTAPGS